MHAAKLDKFHIPADCGHHRVDILHTVVDYIDGGALWEILLEIGPPAGSDKQYIYIYMY